MKPKDIAIVIMIGIALFNNYSLEPVSALTTSSNWYVGGSGVGNMTSIIAAIDIADPGDIIFIYPGIYNETIIIDKSVELIGFSKEDTIIHGDGFNNVIYVGAADVRISQLTIRNSGIYVKTEPTNDTITDRDGNAGFSPLQPQIDLRTISVNFSGIFCEYDDMSVFSCVFNDCTTGIFIRNASKVVISDCTFTDNSQASYIINSTSAQIKGCRLVNNDIGFYFYHSTDSEVSLCNISSHIHTGLIMSYSHDTIIRSNRFMNNTRGVFLDYYSGRNMIFSNLFIANVPIHALDESGNIWDNGIRGNYWDDYEGFDDNDDGIGDTPYNIPIDSTDYFPLFHPVDVDVNDIIITITSPLLFDRRQDTFYISGICSSNTDIEKVLVRIDDGDWILVSGTDEWNQTFNSADYTEEGHDVYIVAMSQDASSTVSQISIQFAEENVDPPGSTSGFHLLLCITAILLLFLIHKRKR